MTTRRAFIIGAAAAGVAAAFPSQAHRGVTYATLPVCGIADPGYQQFQAAVLNNIDDVVNCRWENLRVGDICRRAETPSQWFRIEKFFPDAEPPAFTASPITNEEARNARP